MPTVSKDHRFVTHPTTVPAILWRLLKSGERVKVSTIQKELKSEGRKVTNFPNRVYWFDKWIQELGYETSQEIDGNGDISSIQMVKASKKAEPTKKAKKVKKSKKTSKSASKKTKTSKKRREVESDEPEESSEENESTPDESEEEES